MNQELFKIIYRGVRRILRYVIIRPIQRYNIENRAFKILDKKDVMPAKAAPKHPVTKKFLEQLVADHPEVLDEIKSKPVELLKNLSRIRVVSTEIKSDDNVKYRDENSQAYRNLPRLTRSEPLPVYGIKQPDLNKITPGKVSLEVYIDILKNFRQDPDHKTPEFFASKYQVDAANIHDMLEHFRPFQIYDPKVYKRTEGVPWYTPGRINDFMGSYFAPYMMAKIEAEDEALDAAIEANKDKPKELHIITIGTDDQDFVREAEAEKEPLRVPLPEGQTDPRKLDQSKHQPLPEGKSSSGDHQKDSSSDDQPKVTDDDEEKPQKKSESIKFRP